MQMTQPDMGATPSEKAVSALMTYFANEGFASNLDWFVQAELYVGLVSTT